MTTLTDLKRPSFAPVPAPRPLIGAVPTRWLLIMAGAFTLLLIAKLALANAAKFADPLRHIIGNDAVAQLETWLFTAQDAGKQFTHEVGLAEAEAPWQVADAVWPTVAAVSTAVPTPTPILPTPTPTSLPQPVLVDTNNVVTATVTTTPTPLPPTATPTPTATPWQPAALTPLGTLAGEGIWSPYLLHPATGHPVAYRTFLQPDPDRPFTVVAVVAFDVTAVDLNFVLGSEEPALPGGVHGNGRLPTDDKIAGHLLAAFNGGFMATHGQYGAMAHDLEVLPPKDGLATVAVGKNGRIHIGQWGEEIQPDNNWLFWRQNAHLVVHNGTITPETEANSLYYWSGSINNEVVTWRSGLGLSEDGRTLTYFAGPSLNMPALGQAMVTAGVYQGMLLDINHHWVHFTTFQPEDGELTAVPLLNDMSNQPDRFLRQYQRDFFYITLAETSGQAAEKFGD